MLDKKVTITRLSDEELAKVKKALEPIADKATNALESQRKPAKKFLEAYQR
jgi:hypothetical protein